MTASSSTTPSRPCILQDVGRQAFRPVLALQHQLVQARYARRLTKDVLLIVEHEPVLTLGRQGKREALLTSESCLRAAGLDIVHIERGGDVTYHGPGQIVAYLILDLRQAGLRVTTFVHHLEEVMLRTALDLGVQAERDERNRGIWAGERKLGSVGIALSHGITFHGLALNVDMDLTPFTMIHPCGLQGVGMTSLAQELKHPVPMLQVRDLVSRHMFDVFNFHSHPKEKKA